MKLLAEEYDDAIPGLRGHRGNLLANAAAGGQTSTGPSPRGHPVVTLLGLRGHQDYLPDEDFVWRWLVQSWADSSITSRMNAKALASADSDPVLTVEALQKMTVFWTKFQQESDSIRTVGRMAHQRQILLALGAEPVSVMTMDIAAMAAAYPSVAADLHDAGLTARQETDYRAAILRVGLTRAGGIAANADGDFGSWQANLPFVPIAPNSILGKNLALREAHDQEFQALGKTQMWTTQ